MPQVAIADGHIQYEVTGAGPPLILVSGLRERFCCPFADDIGR